MNSHLCVQEIRRYEEFLPMQFGQKDFWTLHLCPWCLDPEQSAIALEIALSPRLWFASRF